MNENGELFAMSYYLVIAGTIFPHRRKHKATSVSPDGVTENQINHDLSSQLLLLLQHLGAH